MCQISKSDSSLSGAQNKGLIPAMRILLRDMCTPWTGCLTTKFQGFTFRADELEYSARKY